MFHSAGSLDVELRLYSDPASSSWNFALGCSYCNNTSRAAPDRVRLEEIRDVQINTYFENDSGSSSTFSGSYIHLQFRTFCFITKFT